MRLLMTLCKVVGRRSWGSDTGEIDDDGEGLLVLVKVARDFLGWWGLNSLWMGRIVGLQLFGPVFGTIIDFV